MTPGGNHALGVNVEYEYGNERPKGPAWIRFCSPARAEEFVDYVEGQVWYGRTIHCSICPVNMRLGREGELEKGKPRYFRDV